jgi:hypothetical protein
MRRARPIVAGLAAAFGLISSGVFGVCIAAQPAKQATAQQDESVGMPCDGVRQLDTFKGPLAEAIISAGDLAIDVQENSKLLRSGLPCQENVTTDGNERTGLKNLQRGFDFYSWRTFIALNSPADGSAIEHAQPDTPTRWEDQNNFKQLLDVMLPAKLQPPNWPTDTAGMNRERKRLIPPQCTTALRTAPNRTIVQMVEESFNEPFKTGPLIDQNGHYAIFEILMNREMFEYIKRNHLSTQAGQERVDNDDLLVDFPVGQNANPKQGAAPTIGAFMLKVSWKILSQSEIESKTFHTIDALVLLPAPPGATETERAKLPCLPETLGLVGFHAVHKTVGRPQWIWTTFEHRMNVPDEDDITNRRPGPYNFFDAKCTADCPATNSTPPRPWFPKVMSRAPLEFWDHSFRSQIVRKVPVTIAAKNMNTIFHSLLPPDSVWRNYILISTQWPSRVGCPALHSPSNTPKPHTDFEKQPDMTCSPAPTFLANSTLETYSQGEIPIASSSCIACHGNAVDFQRGTSKGQADRVRRNQSDFTFMLEKAQ